MGTIVIGIVVVFVVMMMMMMMMMIILSSSFSGNSQSFLSGIPQLIYITLSARYGQYLTTVHFQKYLVDSTSHTRPLHSPR